MKTVVILSVSSDIGNYLACQYLSRGWRVIGTYRQKKHLKGIKPSSQCLLFKLDVSNSTQIKRFISTIKKKQIRWDRFIASTGLLMPAHDFFSCDFKQWQQSVAVNALGPLEVVHGLYALRSTKPQIVFFAGGAANNAVKHLSAYAISKIMLTKMTEFMDAEYPQLHVSIIGPGWTKTKIHDDLLRGRGVHKEKLLQTKKDFALKPSTALADIDACIEWACSQPKKISSGRNFSVVFDPWRKDTRKKLIDALKQDGNMYKLRRHGNGFLQGRS